MRRISSRSNAHFKTLRLLASSAKERRARARTVLDGPHLLASYLDHGGVPELIVVSERATDKQEVQALVARGGGASVLNFSEGLFAQVAPVASPVGVLAVVKIPRSSSPWQAGSCIVVLDGVQDPGNVGTIIRSAAAAGASDIVLSPGCADAWSPRALRAGMGAHFVVRIHGSIEPAAVLQEFDGTLVATVARGGVAPQAVDLTGRMAILLGSEGSGLSQTGRGGGQSVGVTIPMAAGIESLNVGAAAAVILFERVRQLSLSKPKE